jgi:pimeloyl-ACP methyl ester carboxylesterase
VKPLPRFLLSLGLIPWAAIGWSDPRPCAGECLYASAQPIAATQTPAPPTNEQSEVPGKQEVEALVQEYLELGSRATGPDRERQLAIQARLALLPDLSAADEQRWRKDLLKRWQALPGLPGEKGDNWSWEAEKRGRYIVGGKSGKVQGLLIGMHGGGQGSGDAESSASLYSSAAGQSKWVALFPEVLEKTEHGWTDAGTEEWVLDLIEQARRSFKVDADRVYLAGHSMGGYGSWTLGAHHADRVAALAPAAGAPTPILDRGTGKPIDLDWGIIPSLRNVPMVVYQSRDDSRVPPEVNQLAAKMVAAARSRWGGYEHFTYWEVDGFDHDPPPGGPQAHFEKIDTFVRDPWPSKVVWQPVLPWKRQFYWLAWEQPAEAAIVVAEVNQAENSIALAFDWSQARGRGSAFKLYVDSHVVDLDRPIRVLLNAQTVFEGLPPSRLEVLLETSTSGDPGRQYARQIALDVSAAN